MTATLKANVAKSGTFTFGGLRTINRMGFGAMRITGPGIWGEPKDPAGANAVLRRALEWGVNFIDPANSYGPEVSERLVMLPIPGTSSVAHLEENTAAASLKLSAAEWQEIERAVSARVG